MSAPKPLKKAVATCVNKGKILASFLTRLFRNISLKFCTILANKTRFQGTVSTIGYFRRLDDSRVCRLRPQNLECNFGLSWFRKNREMQFSPQMVLLFGNLSSNLTHYGALVAISVHKF